MKTLPALESEIANDILFSDLPIEILLHTFFYLDPISLLRVGKVSWLFKHLSKNSSLWKHMTLKHFPWYDSINLKKSITWKTLFRLCWKYDSDYLPIESKKAKMAFYWVKESDLENLKTVPSITSLLDSTDARKVSLLNLAQRKNLAHILYYFYECIHGEYIAGGKPMEYKDAKSRNLLHWAILCSQIDAINELISQGMEINSLLYMKEWFSEMYLTPLSLAIYYHQNEVIPTLLENKTSLNRCFFPLYTPLHIAAMVGNIKALFMLISLESDVNSEGYIAYHKYTPLHLATLSGQENAARLLLENGANIKLLNSRLSQNDLFLYIQVFNGNDKAVKVFLDNGANPNSTILSQNFRPGYFVENDRETPLVCAVRRGYKEIVSLLLMNGANVNFSTFPITPLYAGVLNENIDVVHLLLNNGANVNAPNHNDGRTALHQAAALGNQSLVRLLIKWGADAYSIARNRMPLFCGGKTPAMFAKNNDVKQKLELLEYLSYSEHHAGYLSRSFTSFFGRKKLRKAKFLKSEIDQQSFQIDNKKVSKATIDSKPKNDLLVELPEIFLKAK